MLDKSLYRRICYQYHRGGLAEWEQTHGKKKAKVCLDINRPSHGRTELSLTLQGRNARVCFGNVLLARSPFFAIAVAQA
jgi:hypothetical protein